jgi:hypothetical protein
MRAIMTEQAPAYLLASVGPAYLTLIEVAEHYRTTEGTVRYWRQTGYGPRGVKLGTRVLYPRAEIERFDREIAAYADSGPRAAPPRIPAAPAGRVMVTPRADADPPKRVSV